MLTEWFSGLNPILQALLATLFTWGVTAFGAAFVFFFKRVRQSVLDFMLGFAAGVMIAASFWSLLAPGIEMAETMGVTPWLPAVVGFLLGGGFLFVLDKAIPNLHLGLPKTDAEGPPSSMQRSVLLVLAITLHNIPEGLAIGVAFGALTHDIGTATLAGAIALAIGIGIQNFPEGISVSVPLRREGMRRGKAFFYGQASGMVEPIAGVIGAALVIAMRPILPYALSFAAGAMIYVVIEELIPESQLHGRSDLATIGCLGGFAIMMMLDVALG